MSIVNQEYDKKTLEILQMLEDGKSRKEIAEYYGNSTWKSIDMFMRRRGFVWENEMYVEEGTEDSTKQVIQEAIVMNTKAAQIVRMLDVKQPDPRQVAQKQGFENVGLMGEYMAGQGYLWNEAEMNYVYDESLVTSLETAVASSLAPSATPVISAEGLSSQHIALLETLVHHQDELLLWLQYSKEGQVPHYKFRGNPTSKTLTLTSSSVALLNDFSKEFNITQRVILEGALAEYFKKYGYAAQVAKVTT